MQSENSLRALLSGPFSFNARPEPVPGDLRMSWGIAILLLSLLSSRGKRGSFQKLQFLAHSVRIAEGRDDVRALLQGRLRTSDVSVRVEPWLNRAVSYAHALELVSVDKGKSVSLTDKGVEVAKAIANKTELLSDERAFLSEVAPKLPTIAIKDVRGHSREGGRGIKFAQSDYRSHRSRIGRGLRTNPHHTNRLGITELKSFGRSGRRASSDAESYSRD